MEELAIFGIMMIFLISIILQHISNWFVRLSKDVGNESLIVLAIVINIFSLLILYVGVSQSIKLF